MAPPPPGSTDRAAADPLSGAVAFVTGAGSGIGAALSRELSARGALVVLADIDEGRARAVAETLEGARGSVVALDVTDGDAVREAVTAAAGDHGRLDLVFNNAGIGVGGPVEALTPAHWQRVLEVDLWSVIHGVSAAYPLMIAQGSGHIVNTASLAGIVPSPFLTPYAAAKSAVVGLSVSLRVEAAAHGVKVSAVCPGPVETPLLDAPNAPDLPAVKEAPSVRALLTNALGTPYDPRALAADILAGVEENRALIVAPHSARAAWGADPDDPEALLAAMAGQAVRSAERRRSRTGDAGADGVEHPR